MTSITPPAPALVGPDGPTTVTGFLLVHHGLRRDLARFRDAFDGHLPAADLEGLRRHWDDYRLVLDVHHRAEDDLVFPALRRAEPDLGVHLDALEHEHQELDDLLGRCDRAMADAMRLPDPFAGRRFAELHTFVDAHLTSEEVHLVPSMRRVTLPPAQPDGEVAPDLLVGWTTDGVAEEVVASLPARMEPGATQRLRDAWADRRRRTWGPDLRVGTAITARPTTS